MGGLNAFLNEQGAKCPPKLIEFARAGLPARVAIARAGSALPMQAAKDAFDAGLMTPIFVGEAQDIQSEADALSWDISSFQMIDTIGEEEAGKVAAELCGRGAADILMKGQLHTDVFMKTALARDAGLRVGTRFVHIFHMSKGDDAAVLISDAAVNVAPDIDTRKDATRAVVKLLRALGTENPKVAFLSATETPIPSVRSAVEGRALADWAKGEIQGAEFSGPLALDLILSEKSKEIKGLQGDPVAGQADAIIVPDIVSGNVLFKSITYMAGACAAGVVVGGKVPMLLTSRADSAQARLASVALACIWAKIKN